MEIKSLKNIQNRISHKKRLGVMLPSNIVIPSTCPPQKKMVLRRFLGNYTALFENITYGKIFNTLFTIKNVVFVFGREMPYSPKKIFETIKKDFSQLSRNILL